MTEFYENTNGTNWLQQTNWLSDESVCTWFGVVCDENEHIVEISLDNNVLVGSNRDSISKVLTLQDLQVLDLLRNDIDLDFNAIVDNSKLQILRLAGIGLKSLSGIGRATSLRLLYASNNQIQTLPDELFGLSNLEGAFLSYNAITGTFPRRFGLMTSLQNLYIFRNRLTGSLPTEIGLMTSLEKFLVGENYLSGTLPSELSSLPALGELSVCCQQGTELITGAVPSFSSSPRLS